DLYELFYDTGVHSRVSFHTRIVCCEASIEDLNVLYRIMRDRRLARPSLATRLNDARHRLHNWSPWRKPFR
ncbi:MAG: hypothetical protein ACRD1X_05315, partial [Vicinamibacteria bacterium]